MLRGETLAKQLQTERESGTFVMKRADTEKEAAKQRMVSAIEQRQINEENHNANKIALEVQSTTEKRLQDSEKEMIAARKSAMAETKERMKQPYARSGNHTE